MRLRFHAGDTLVILLLLVPILLNLASIVNARPTLSPIIYDPPAAPSMPLPVIGYAPSVVPVSGIIRVVAIAAAFADVNYTLSITQLRKAWFGAVATYYHEISYGRLTIKGDVYGWYRLPYPKAHYGKNCKAVNDADCSGLNQSYHLAIDAAALAEKSVNFNNYDYYVFIHSGPGQETSGDRNDVWSVTYMGTVSIKTDSKTFTKFNIIPELEAQRTVPNGVWCLEFGHNLGLPDLYNTNNGKTILGPWELMDKGSFNGNPPGSSPAHMIAWDKIQLGFINGSMLATAYPGVTSTFTVDPTEIASTKVHAVKIHLTISADPNPAQYYLVEVRAKTGFDSALPATGVLITYVDETLTVGRVQVMNHPGVTNLDYAAWNVGETFTDNNHNLTVAVKGKVANSYQITIAGTK
jgi:M6 family metalloprotease-like protein